ncbi:uncharacterized protein LOC115448759 isoform X2 [Manduca sexta]|nr:uncharacterized protein LOC115448759 isoform X2 [Manduca sexta]XP_037293719.1 uncharacterized protein LOC115448759 isoform X2 [Manduca sexta]
MSAQKGMPLNREEVMGLLELVAATPVVYSKGTNAASNRMKEAAWIQITEKFNSLISTNPRKPEQLRLKWENLKKGARKRSHRIAMNYKLQTRGGRPEFIPPDEVLDKVSDILGESIDGSVVQFVGEGVENMGEPMEEIGYQEEPVVGMPFTQESSDNSESQPQPSASNSNFFCNTENEGKQKSKTLSYRLKESVIRRNNAIAQYYETKKRNEEELFQLQKRKLELELSQKNGISEKSN